MAEAATTAVAWMPAVGRIGHAEESLAGGRLAREGDGHEDRTGARGGHGVGVFGVTKEGKVGGRRFGQGGDTGERTCAGTLDGFGPGQGGEFGDGEGGRHVVLNEAPLTGRGAAESYLAAGLSPAAGAGAAGAAGATGAAAGAAGAEAL